MGKVTHCGLCGCQDLSTLLDMGEQPLAERFDQRKLYPLKVLGCMDCGLAQLSYIVDAGELFPPDHPYTSGTSAALREHFGLLTEVLAAFTRPGDVVVDIGANDGTLLSSYPPAPGVVRVAVEPTNQAAKCIAKGFRTWQQPFTARLAREIVATWGQAKIVTATNVLAHVPDPHDFAEGVRQLLTGDGMFVTENHSWPSVSRGLQIDTVYHEHLRYYSIATLARLLEMHGLDVTGCDTVDAHGGSVRSWARLKATGDLQLRADGAANALQQMLRNITAFGSSVYGIGAATRAVPLIHFAQIAPYIKLVCEVAGSEKIGQVMPGTSIRVVDEKALITDQPAYALLFAWHIAGHVMPKLRQMGYKGQFIIPLPKPKVIEIG
jgi:hypothetical protein